MVKNVWRERIFSLKDFLKPYEHGVREFPFYVDIELTNHCNFDCVMCQRSIMERDMGWMSVETHARIIDEVSHYAGLGVGVRYVRHGEPTLHPNLGEMLRYASEKKVLTYVSTNAFLLDRMADNLLSSGLNFLRISMQGVNRTTYSQMRDPNNHNHYLRIVRNITDFMLRREQAGLDKPFVEIGTSVTNETDAEKEMFRKFWEDIVDSVQIGITTFSRLEGKVEEVGNILSELEYREDAIRNYRPCTEVRTKLSINWNGDITACCSDVNGRLVITADNDRMANVAHTSLKEAWESSFLSELRDVVGPSLRHQERYPCCDCYRDNITDKFKKMK